MAVLICAAPPVPAHSASPQVQNVFENRWIFCLICVPSSPLCAVSFSSTRNALPSLSDCPGEDKPHQHGKGRGSTKLEKAGGTHPCVTATLLDSLASSTPRFPLFLQYSTPIQLEDCCDDLREGGYFCADAPLHSLSQIRASIAREAGLAEWQANTFYSAGRVMLPSLMDTLACMTFYSPSGVVDQIVPALAGVGDPTGAVLRQVRRRKLRRPQFVR